MATFWELVQQSVIVQSIITLVLIGTVAYLYVTGQEVPRDLMGLTVVVLGFWFGSKSQGAVNNHQAKKVIREVMANGQSRK